MFSFFSTCTNYCRTELPSEPAVLPYNEMFENAQPLSRTEHSHLPYKRYTTRCSFGCIKPTNSSKNQVGRDYKN